MINELGLTARFIVTTLKADPAVMALVQGRIYRNLATANGGTPYIVFSLVPTACDINAIGARHRLATVPLYLIKGVSEGPDDTIADAVSDALDNALVGAKDEVGATGLIIQGCYRTMPVDYAEDSGGIVYNHRGGQYHFFVSKTGG